MPYECRPEDVHGMVVEFGKHKGELWTRVPVGYLHWVINNLPEGKPGRVIAEAELERRGDTMPTEVNISNHAIDRASLRIRRAWHEDRGEDEGLYSWLVRICSEVDLSDHPERVHHKGAILVFEHGNHFPSLKTVFNDKNVKFPKRP